MTFEKTSSGGHDLGEAKVLPPRRPDRTPRWSELSSFVVVLDEDHHSVVVAHQREVAESADYGDNLPVSLYDNERELVIVIRALEIDGHFTACAEAGIERTVTVVSCQS